MKKTVAVIGCVLPMASMAMADRTAPVYGRPTLYGEYEISSGDTRRAAVLYGVTPKNAAAKMPVKPKKVMPKKSVKKKKTPKKVAPKKQVEPMPIETAAQIVADDVIVVPPREITPDVSAHVAELPAKKLPEPSAEAVAIADAAKDSVPNLESFCTRRGIFGKGKQPDGIVLMPGRPDLMSCSDKE